MDERSFSTKDVSNEVDVIAFYDGYASYWDDRFGQSLSTPHFLERRWKSFMDVLGAGTNTLVAMELGVGTGVYIDKASKIFEKVIAVDGSRRMLDELEKRVKIHNLKNIFPIQSNVVSLGKVADSSIDIIYFFGLIEHIVDVNGFIIELHRVLRAGGVIIGVTPNGSSPWYIVRRFVRGTGKHCITDKYYSISEIDIMFKQFGFQIEEKVIWGSVPAGINNYYIYRLLAFLEVIFEKSYFAKYLGGLTFKVRKTS